MTPLWKEAPLAETLSKLIDYRGRSPQKSIEGIPVISAKVVGNGRISNAIEQKIAPEYYVEWMRRGLPEAGDVVMTTEGPLGEVAQLDFRTAQYALGQRIVVLRGRHGVLDNTFLRFLLQSPEMQRRLEARATGTTVSGISQKSLREVPLPLPPFTEQQAIGRILRSLDDKIELNRRMSATLEEMARALFRSWFVDFDPVHAKVRGEAPAHMDAATAALFPDRFGEDGLPEEWSAGVASDLLSFNPKEALKKGTLAPYYDMKAIPTAGHRADAPIERAFGSGTKFRRSDVLLARITPCLENGKTALIDNLNAGDVAWGSTEFIVLRGRAHVAPGFVYCLARDESFRACAIQSMVGSSGRQRVQQERLEQFPAPIPPSGVLDAYGALVKPMFERMRIAGDENENLAALRDTLLPKLMSGELRVRDAEQQIAEAV